MQLTGIHHVTAVSGDIRTNFRFYTQVMGMRLVKRSVNQDDVSAYHLFYADSVGSPGTDLTFFDWPVPRERRGTHSIIQSALRVLSPEALDWWQQRLTEQKVAVDPAGITEIDGRRTLRFEDPEGQRLALIDDGGTGDTPILWEDSPVPPQYQVRGLGPVVMSVPDLTSTDLVLTRVMGMRPVREYAHPDNAKHRVFVYAMTDQDNLPHTELHVAVQPDLPPVNPGAGGVHHVAFRTPNEEQYHAWTQHLRTLRVPNSGEVDRYYFRSLYFREPNGILFEIATDGPGFGVDEDSATLGNKVVLPPFLENRREEIVSKLKPLE